MKKRIFLVLFLLGFAALLLYLFHINPYMQLLHQNAPSPIEDDYYIEVPDAKQFYEEHTEIIASYHRYDSQILMTDQTAKDTFDERGFENIEICYPYTDGGYPSGYENIDLNEISFHPMYEALYLSASNVVWTLYFIEGTVMAYPATYVSDKTVILSEQDTITSYDAETGMFYVTIPNASECKIITVDMITKEVLDSMTKEALDAAN